MANSLLDRIVATLFTKKTTPRAGGVAKRSPRSFTRKLTFPALCLAAALLVGAQTASAASIYWNAQTGKWEVAENWNVGSQTGATHQVPGTSDYAYINNGGTVQVDAATGTALSNWLYVGSSGTGVLNLTGGGKAIAYEDIRLGYNAGSHGTVNIGAGSELYNTNSTGWIVIGNSGTGVLNLTGGGKATSTSTIYLGYNVGSSGTATVSGTGSELKNNAGDLTIGRSGTGVLNLTDGGKATSASSIYLGVSTGSSGTVKVDGQNSLLESGYQIVVGSSGTGVLNLTGGGKATSASDIVLGAQTGSSGTVKVGGTNSLLENTGGALFIGFSGTGVLNLTNGGKATSASDIYLGYNAGSSGTVTVGSGSTLQTGTNVYVGGSNSGEQGGASFLGGTGTVIAPETVGVRVFNGSTLSAGDYSGQVGRLNIDGNLRMDAGSTLRVDLSDSSLDYIQLAAGKTSTVGAINIDLTSLHRTVSNFGILRAPGGLTYTANSATVLLNGETIPTTGRAAGVTVTTATSGYGENLNLTITGAPTNATLTWDPNKTGDQNWNLTDANWTGHASGQFLDGDRVIFNSGGANITLGGTGKTVADMNVSSGGDYTFNGNILADGTKTTLSGRSGQLYKDNTGTLTLNGENEFMGGIALFNGTIVLGNDKALGAYATGETKGQVTAMGGAISTFAGRTISNRFNVTNGLTFDVAAGKTLTVSYVDAGTADGGALAKSGSGTLNVGSGVVFDRNSARQGGAAYIETGIVNFNETVFSYNSASTDTAGAANAASGGALYVGGGTVNLSGVTFSNNSVTATNTSGTGNAHGGALYMAGGTVTFTGDTLFEGNKTTSARSANHYGGAIYYAGGTLNFNGDTVFSKNHADGGGGAILANTALDLSSSTGSLTFTGNSAGYGGGIYSFSSFSPLTLGDHATFTGNSAGFHGGGIYASSVTLGDHATFTGNSAVNNGGGIAASSLTLGDHATFTGNSANGSGGGIFAVSSLTLGDHATFTGNSANGFGGGIFANTSLTLGDHATFTDNSAIYSGGIYANSWVTLGDHATFTGNTANGDGGGILANSSVTLGGNTLFENNLAEENGGAIFLGGGTATLDADGGAIAFTGNKSGVTFTGGKPVAGTGTANSIHMVQNTLLALTGSGNIYFDDPISSELGSNRMTKSGSGFVQFVGDSYLNRTAYGGGTVTVSGGAFRVVDGANFYTYGSAATFTTATGTTLSGGGTITAQQGFTISGTVSPDADRFEIPDYDYTTKTFAHEPGTVSPDKLVGTLTLASNTTFSDATLAVDLASASSYDKIAVTGTVAYTGTTVIDLGNFLVGNYTGIVSATSMGALGSYDVKLNGNALGARQKAEAAVAANKLNLTLSDGHNLDLTWRGGAGGTWDTSTVAWNTTTTGTTPNIAFQTNDYVTFTSGANATGAVNVQAGGVTVSGMLVTAGTHTFSGGSITGVNAADNGQTRTGKYEQQAGTVTFNNTTSFANGYEINGGTLTVGTGGSIFGNVLNNAQLTFSGTDAKAYGGDISGTGNVTKSGTGTLTLSGTNTYSGNTTVSGGTLSITSDANIGGGTNTISSGTLQLTGVAGTEYSKGWTLGGTNYRTISNANDVTMSGVLSGTGGLEKTGAGTLTLSGTNTYTGNTSVGSGSGPLIVTGNLGNGTYDGNISIASGRSLVFNQNSNQTLSGVISSGGALTKDGTGTLTLSGANTYTGNITISDGTLLVTGTLGGGTHSRAIVNNADLVFDQTASQTLSGVISGTGSLTKQGTGTLTLSGANTYTGTTTLSGTTGSTLALGNNQTFRGAVNTDSNTIFALGTHTATLLGGTNTISGNVTGTGILSIGNGSAANVIYAGPSTKAFTGTTHIGAGSSLTLSGAGLDGQRLRLTGTGTVNAGGNTVDLFGTSSFGGTLTGGTFEKTDGTTTTLSNTAMNAGASDFSVDSGTLALTGNLTTTGDVSVENLATLVIAVNEQLSATLTANSLTVGTTGIINVSGFTGGQSDETYLLVDTGSNNMTFNPNTVVQIGGGTADPENYLAGTVEFGTGGTDLTKLYATVGLAWYALPATAHGTFNIANGDVAPISTNLIGRGGDGPFTSGWDGETLTKKGTGTLVLSGTNTYTGATSIEAGTLSITHADALQGTSGIEFAVAHAADTKIFDLNYDSDGTFAKQITGTGTLQKSGDARVLLTPKDQFTVNDFTGATVVKAGTLAINSISALNGTSGVTVESGAVFELADTNLWFQKSISGAGSVLKTGTALTTIDSQSTYSGGTTIAAGTLNIRYTDSLGTGTVDVADAATLEFQNASAIVFSNTITGGGTLKINGDVTLARHNIDHTGEVSIVSGKTLTLSPLLAADEWNYTNTITDFNTNGNLTKIGDGKLILAGNNSYTGTTTVKAGTLTLTSSTSAGSETGGNLLIDDDATLELDFAAAGTFAKNIVNGTVSSNTGKLVKSGDNRVALSGTNTFTGATEINEGTLVVTKAAALSATSGVAVADGAFFELAYTANGNFDRTISGLGGVVKTGSTTVTLTAASSYQGGTDIKAGTLALAHNDAVGDELVSIGSGATLQLGSVGTFTGGPIFDNEISGTGTVAVDADVSRQRHDSTFSGNFDVNAPYTLTLDYAADTVFGNVISGDGNVTKTDANLLTLSGVNTNTGTFTQSTGDVHLASNWAGNYTQSAGSFTAANNATISGTATFSGAVALDENLNVDSLTFAGATVAFDVDNDLFTVTGGGVAFSGSNTLNAVFASGVQLGTYDIAVVTGGGTVADPGTWTYTLGSTHLDGYNLDARGSGIVRNEDNTKLQLRVALDAIDLTWSGTAVAGGDLWTNNPTLDTVGNWTNGGTGSLLETKFRDGDKVTFNLAGTPASTVNVAASVTVSTMTVDGATYSFTGIGGISSTSTLTLENNATVTLANSGTNTFGNTAIENGSTLNIGGGGTTGNLSGTITNDGTLVLYKSNNYTLNNAISGTGTTRMDGSGTVTIGGTGTSQSNAFQQTSGIVHLSQQWTGNYTQTGGVLTGDGTISGNLVSATDIRPGGETTIGTLTVTGSADFTGATLRFKVDGADSDLIAVDGIVTIGSGAGITTIDILNFTPGGTTYTLLTGDNNFWTDDTSFTTLVGGSAPSGRQTVTYDNSDLRAVKVSLTSSGNETLIWAGNTGDLWRGANRWTKTAANDETFIDGDTVIFNDPTLPQTVDLGTSDVTVAGVTVNGGDYTFTGDGVGIRTNGVGTKKLDMQGGRVILANTGTSNFTGGIDIGQYAQVQLGNNNNGGTLDPAVTITNNGELVFSRNDNFTFTNTITGAGTVTQSGSGTVILNGSSQGGTLHQNRGTINLATTWTGDFVQTAGTFSGSGTLNGDATISDTVAPNGTLTLGSVEFIGDSTPGLGATISIGALGTDMIAVNGTTTFDVSNGKIKVDLGTWTLGAGTILDDTLADTLNIGATFEDVTLNGQALSGRQTADLSVLNGDLILTASAQNEIRTWTGAAGNSWDKNNTESWLEDDNKFIDGDKVVFNATGALVPNVNVAENLIASEMTVDADSDYTFSGASITTDATTWSGTGTASGKLVKNGTGTATFNNANDFKAGTDLNAGRINVGNNLALGTQAVRMVSDTTLGFTGNHTITNVISLQGDAAVDTGSNNAVMTGKIGGNYTLTKDGAGTLTLEAANEHGATDISKGRLIAKRAASLGSGNADIESGATLELDFSDELSNAVSGSGSLENKGDILLSGDHSQFTGTTFVLTGKTTLGDGFNSGSAFDIASTLAGNGRMNDDLIVRTGATLSPGNSVGRIETGGNTIFENGAKYEVEIDIAADEADLLVAAGNVTVGDTSELHVEVLDVANIDSATEYLVIESTGGTINRTFADDYFIEKALYGFTQELRSGNQLYLTLQRKQSNFAGLLAGLGYPNAYNAAAAVDAVDAAGEATKLGSLFDALGNLDVDADTYLAAFTQLHGEVFAASREAAAQTQRRFLRQLPTARDRALKTSCDPCGAANSFNQWNRWANFTGDWLNRNDIGNFSGYDLRTAGVAFGMDKNVTKKLFVGAAFGYDDATLKFDTLRIRNEMDVFRSILYGGWRSGRTYVDSYIGYTKNWHKTRRDITIGNFAGTARSKFDDDMLSTGLEIGRKLRFGRLNVTPSVGLHYIYLDSPSITETGANGANLYVHGGKYDSLRLPLGARFNRDFRMLNGMIWTPELRAFYVAELADDSASVRTSFNNVRSIGFTASSGHWGRSSGVFGVGLKGQLSDRLSLRVDYDHEVYEHTDMGEFSVSAGVNW